MQEPGHLWHWLAAGLAGGLGGATKSTMLIYAAPLICVLGGWFIFRLRAKFIRFALVFTMAFVVMNAHYMTRNYHLFGSPIGSPTNFGIEQNARFGLGVTFSNFVRNLALHSNCGIPPLTRLFNRGLELAHSISGEPLNDPATTYRRFRFADPVQVTDSRASCTWHALLILVACGVAIARARENRHLLVYLALIFASALLFCGYLKWQLWHSRRHLAYLLLSLPPVAIGLLTRFRPWVSWIAAAVVTISATVTIVKNDSRPFLDRSFTSLPRELQYQFAHNRDGNGPTREVAESIVASGCHRVGLKIGSDDAEYPLWQMLRNRGFTGEIHHVNVENESGRIPTRGGEPCVFILKNVEINWEKVPGVSRQFGPLTVIFSGNRKQDENQR